MKKPIKGQLLYKYTQERVWGGKGGYADKWHLVEVTKVGRKYYYTKRLGWNHEDRHELENFGTRYTSTFSSVEEVRQHFMVGVARDALYDIGVRIDYYTPHIKSEDIMKMCEVFPEVMRKVREGLDNKIAPVLELEKQAKEMSLCP